MSNYLNLKDIHKQKYSKKQGLGFGDKQKADSKKKNINKLTKQKLIQHNINQQDVEVNNIKNQIIQTTQNNGKKVQNKKSQKSSLQVNVKNIFSIPKLENSKLDNKNGNLNEKKEDEDGKFSNIKNKKTKTIKKAF